MCVYFLRYEDSVNHHLIPLPLSPPPSGGKYFVTGGTDHIIRVYMCIPGPPTLQAELDSQHKVRNDKFLSTVWIYTVHVSFPLTGEDYDSTVWQHRGRVR